MGGIHTMDAILEACITDDVDVYGALSDDYDCAINAVEDIEDAELSTIINTDEEDDEILTSMGVDLDDYEED